MAIYKESTIVRIDCDPPVLLWSGVGFLAVPADSVIPAPAIALGGGQIISVPDFQQLIGGTAERLDFVVSGVDDQMLQLAMEEAPSVRGARVDIGTGKFDDGWQLVTIEWENVFEARALNVSRPKMQGGKATRSVTLTIVQGSTRRARASQAYFTDADQRRRSADDAIFSHVARITSGTSRRFGPSD